MRPGLPLAAIVITLLPAAAQEKAGDFTEGLKQLAALGLPPMEGAIWVGKPRADLLSYTDSSLRLPGLGMKGAVWKLPGETPKYLDFGSAEFLESPATKSTAKENEAAKKPADGDPGILQKMLDRYAAEQPAKPKPTAPATPKANLVEEDVHQLVAALAKTAASRQARNSNSFDFDGEVSDPSGRCLIFAAQLQAAGQTAAASELVTALFQQTTDKSALIDSAIDQLASAEYEAATQALFASHDWKAYETSLKALLAKYPRGWSSSGAVAMLMVPLEKRVTSPPPPPPALPGVELKPKALAKVAAMLEPPGVSLVMSDEEYARSRHINLDAYPASRRAQIVASIRANDEGSAAGSLWVLAPDPKMAGSANAVEALTGMGMDGLAALAAIARDDTLTLLPLPGNRTESRYYFSSGNSDGEEQITAQKYKSMARPRTRGEIAIAILSQMIPTGEDRSEPETETLIDEAVTFWTENHGKTPLELAVVYLNEGSENQKTQAADFLADLKTPEARAALEKAIVTSSAPADYASFATGYLGRLGPAGRPFFDAYSKVLHEALDGIELSEMGYTSGSYVIRQAGSLESYLRTLSLKVGVVALKDLVAKAMKSGQEDDWKAVASGMTSSSPADVLALLGPAAAKASPEQLSSIYRLLYVLRYDNQFGGGNSDSTRSVVEIPESTRSLWKPLLSSSAPLPKDQDLTPWANVSGATNCGDLAALLLDGLISPDSLSGVRIYTEIEGTGTGVAAFVHHRMEAWADQKPLPEWPAPDQVAAPRKQEIAVQIGKLGAKDLLPFASSLSLSEKAYVCLLVQGYDGVDSPVPGGVAELRHTVVACRNDPADNPSDESVLKAIGIADGYQISETGLLELLDSCTAKAATLTRTVVSFQPGPMLLGYVASARRVNDQEGREGLSGYADYFGNATAISLLSCGANETYRAVRDGKVVSAVPTGEDGPIVEQGDTGDSMSLKKVFERKSAIPVPIKIEVLTAADAQKLKPADQ